MTLRKEMIKIPKLGLKGSQIHHQKTGQFGIYSPKYHDNHFETIKIIVFSRGIKY